MKRLLHLTWVCLAFAACSQEDLPDMHGAPASLTLCVTASQNNVKSRAVSSDSDEKRIHNLYILIFNSDGSVDYREYIPGLNLESSWSKTISGLVCGTGKSVAAIANTKENNTVADITKEMLDGIASRTALEALVVNIEGEFIERGTSFLMTGLAENITVAASSGNTVEVPLKRIDAKIRFRISAGQNSAGQTITFTPNEWRVISLPRMAGLMTPKSDLCDTSEECFDSEWMKFEEEGNTFAFYMLEGMHTPRQPISGTGVYENDYALREKQDKTDNSDGTVTNGAFTYAPETGTYVQIRGQYYERANETTEVSADVVYTIHLGGVEQNANDYNTLRNTYYTYNSRITGVDKIITEVISSPETEERPGAEGDVTLAKKIIQLDAYNEVRSLAFHYLEIGPTMTWTVSTPFTNGTQSEADTPEDYRWVFFRINTKNSLTYTSNFRDYAGEGTDKVYAKGETVDLDAYIASVSAGTDKMLDVKQLVTLLKANEERRKNNGTNLYDSSNQIHFTAFINEYYYETDPRGTGETAERGLWKKFVNQPSRVMNILSEIQRSPDGESSKTTAVFSIRQSSIQTMYNRSSTEQYTAWGTQMIQDDTPVVFEKTVTKTSSLTTLNNYISKLQYKDGSNGRKNTILMWLNGNTSLPWNDYITPTSWTMKPDYDAAKYKCLRMNRDNNGNGRIDETEVQWYLAAINQLTDIWIGEWSYDPTARLYKKTNWTEGADQYFASSTVLNAKNNNYTIFGATEFWDLPQILWSAEGSSVGPLSQSYGGLQNNQPVHYRCVRNLGIPRTADKDVQPDDVATYDPTTRIISLDRIDAQSIRGYFQTDELPEHHEREATNKPWRAFEVQNTISGNYYTWESLRAATTAGNSPCPEGYRVPNQRELALMFSRIGNDGNWSTRITHFSRTRFQFGSAGRPGFAIKPNCETIFLVHGTDETGGVRCVKDINQSR